MIARLDSLRKRPAVFAHLTGLTVAAFDELAAEVAPAVEAAHRRRLDRPGRQRAPGGGDTFDLTTADQLLLTVVWLRQYPTNEVLGFLFGVSDSTASRARTRCLPALEKSGRDTMRMPDPGPGRRKRLPALLADTPGLAVVVDSFEQRTQRPRRGQRAYYSGKKKAHTLKSQVAVDEQTGRLVDVSESVPGRRADIKLLGESRVLGGCRRGSAYWATSGTWGSASCTRWARVRAASRAGRSGLRRTGGTTGRSAVAGSSSSTRSGGCAGTGRWPT